MTSGRSKKHRKEKRRDREKARKHHQQRKTADHAVLRGEVENNQCLLPLVVSHPHRETITESVQAIIDTGATHSTIRADIVQRLGLPIVDKVACRTVHGTKEAPVVAAQSRVQDGQTTAARFLTAIVPDQQADDMLFGMDAMQGGILTVDTNKTTWEWRLTQINRK